MKEVLIALAVGIGIGVLIAPDKGSNTLQKIRDQFDDILDEASDTGKNLFKEGKSRVQGAAKDVQHAAKRFE